MCGQDYEAPSPRQVAERVFRAERGRVLAALRRVTVSLDEAEDVLSIAVEKALVTWPEKGVPDRPGAWLLHVARNEALGAIRHRKMAEAKHEDQSIFPREVTVSEDSEGSAYPDERLALLFTCCHPALSGDARVALTLSTLSGLSTAEIARAFLVPDVTMAQRLVRAKKKIRLANVPYEVPSREQMPDRLSGVIQVIYLVFTEGYRASRGPVRIRFDLCEDALLLSRALSQLLPNEPEALGLEALLWFHHARRDARLCEPGSFTYLDAQDRSLFRQQEILHAEQLLHRALRAKELGPYQLQAAIAAQHCLATSFDTTPWEVIIQLYSKLYEMAPSPVVALNRAAAIGIAHGAGKGIAEMEKRGLSRSLDGYGPYHSARGELLRRSGERSAARAAYKRAISMVENGPEIAHLEARLKEVEEN